MVKIVVYFSSLLVIDVWPPTKGQYYESWYVWVRYHLSPNNNLEERYVAFLYEENGPKSFALLMAVGILWKWIELLVSLLKLIVGEVYHVSPSPGSEFPCKTL